MKKTLLLFLLIFTGSISAQQNEINNILNQWHLAAEQANFEVYFSHFTEDAHFIGTDASENWTVTEFKNYAKASFEKAPAWKFTPLQRNVEVTKNKQFAWFDEILTSSHLGVCRGSGVLVFENETWKIKHYVLSLIVPNTLAREVAKLKKVADAESLTELIRN